MEISMDDTMKQIYQRLRTHADRFSREYHVRRFGVFGSYSRGTQTETSDIDVLVELDEPIGLFQFVELEEQLENLLGRKVDLVTPSALKPAIRDDVLRQTLYV